MKSETSCQTAIEGTRERRIDIETQQTQQHSKKNHVQFVSLRLFYGCNSKMQNANKRHSNDKEKWLNICICIFIMYKLHVYVWILLVVFFTCWSFVVVLLIPLDFSL